MRIGAVVLLVFVVVLVAVIAFRLRQPHHRSHAADPDVMKNLRLRVLQADTPSGALSASPQEPFAVIHGLRDGEWHRVGVFRFDGRCEHLS